jgi:hypothetical protein
VTHVAETIEQSARRIGHHAWVEMRLFELLGRWSGTVPEPRAQALFASHSRHHAWHTELWHSLLPVVPHLAAVDLVAPDEADAALIASLEALDEGDAPGTARQLTAVYREVLPHLDRSLRAHLDVATPVTDGPTMRVLRMVLADIDQDRVAGDQLIEALGAAEAPGAAGSS